MILGLLKSNTFQDSQAGLYQVSILQQLIISFLSAFIFISWFRILTVTTFWLFENLESFLLVMVSQIDFDPTIHSSIECLYNLRVSLSISKNSLARFSGNTFFVSTSSYVRFFFFFSQWQQSTSDSFVLSLILWFSDPVSW